MLLHTHCKPIDDTKLIVLQTQCRPKATQPRKS